MHVEYKGSPEQTKTTLTRRSSFRTPLGLESHLLTSMYTNTHFSLIIVVFFLLLFFPSFFWGEGWGGAFCQVYLERVPPYSTIAQQSSDKITVLLHKIPFFQTQSFFLLLMYLLAYLFLGGKQSKTKLIFSVNVLTCTCLSILRTNFFCSNTIFLPCTYLLIYLFRHSFN